jgi:hemoglobin/transferrin/lactoferrin receptor protein
MRISGFSLVVLICLSGYVYSQKIEVVDINTGKGIENVSIYNLDLNKSTQSDSKGFADLSAFSKGDKLNFQHPSYHEKTLSFNDIKQSGFKVELDEKIIKIDEVIISASKWEQNPGLIANSVTRISLKTIEFDNPPTSADMLDKTGQVFVQKSQLGGGSPMIRGFAANRLLIVVDGVRMNNAIYRSGNLQNVISIDVNTIEEAEVLFGPGSVMYGSDALGGVMDFHTGSPRLNGNNSKTFNGKALLRYSTAANEKTVHVDFSLAGKKFGSFTSFSFTDFADLKTGNKRTRKFPDYGKRTEFVKRINVEDTIIENNDVNLQKYSGYRQFNMIQKFKLRPKDYLDLDYGFYFTNSSDIPRYDRLILYDEDSIPESAEWYYGPHKWIMNRFSCRVYKSNKMYSEARFILSHQFVNESRTDRKFKEDIRRTREEKVHVINFNADFDKTINENHELYYGIDFSYNKVNSEAEEENIETNLISPTSARYPDGGSNYGFLAVYAHYLWLLNGKHSINAGIRYTNTWLWAKLNDQGDIGFEFDEFANNNGALNGSLGWVYNLNTKTKIDLIASSGFRAPNVDDMGKLFDSEPGYVIVPNKDLGPEYAYNLEMGMTQRMGQNLEFHLVGFYTWLVDAMVRHHYTFNGMDSIVYDGELRKTQALINTGRANIYGFSFSFRGDISEHFGIFSSVNYTNGKDVIEDVPLRHTAPIFGRTSLFFRQKSLFFEFNVNYSGRKTYEDLSPSEKNKIYLYTSDGALAWYTLNLMTSYELRNTFIFNFGIENILNKHYRTYSSGISAPGRNFIFGLRVKL